MGGDREYVEGIMLLLKTQYTQYSNGISRHKNLPPPRLGSTNTTYPSLLSDSRWREERSWGNIRFKLNLENEAFGWGGGGALGKV